MGVSEVELKMRDFMRRKEVEFPELALSGRHESRTAKYAADLRASGQLILDGHF